MLESTFACTPTMPEQFEMYVVPLPPVVLVEAVVGNLAANSPSASTSALNFTPSTVVELTIGTSKVTSIATLMQPLSSCKCLTGRALLTAKAARRRLMLRGWMGGSGGCDGGIRGGSLTHTTDVLSAKHASDVVLKTHLTNFCCTQSHWYA